MLVGFGFFNSFHKLIAKCVQTPWFSIMISGMYKGFFQLNRCLPQGNPLSSYLFIVMEEILSRLQKKQFELGKIGRFFHPRGALLILHLLHVDDLLIFCNGDKRSLKMLMKTLKIYERWSIQMINKEKLA